jgi:hypothetical protein
MISRYMFRASFVFLFCVLQMGVGLAYAQKDSSKSNKKSLIQGGGTVIQLPNKSDSIKEIKRVPFVIEHGDTIPVYTLQDTKVTQPPLDPADIEKQKEWERLLRNVRYLMQYANICAYKMKEIDTKMAAMDKRHDRRKYLKEEREQMVNDYSKTLKDLSAYQGKLLIKLIYRQTGKTTYDIIKDYESGFTATFWQTLSSLDAMDLKDTYDPQKDVMIETAIKQSGYK